MSGIAIVADSNSGMTQERAKKLGFFILPMSFMVNDKICYEGIDLTHEQFYHALSTNAQVSTSQPTPTEVTDLWNRVLREYDQIVYIPMSSGLSASCATATALAEDYNGRVEVVNNQRISVTQYQSMLYARALAERGLKAREIKETLEKEALNSSIYIMVDTLKYLKKGGRITPAAAAVGTVLHLKPVLQIQGEKLDAFAKCRGVKMAKKTMLDAIHKDLDTRFADFTREGTMGISYSYSYMNNPDIVKEWVGEIQTEFPGYKIYGEPLALSIGCHIGEGALAITCQHVLT